MVRLLVFRDMAGDDATHICTWGLAHLEKYEEKRKTPVLCTPRAHSPYSHVLREIHKAMKHAADWRAIP